MHVTFKILITRPRQLKLGDIAMSKWDAIVYLSLFKGQKLNRLIWVSHIDITSRVIYIFSVVSSGCKNDK